MGQNFVPPVIAERTRVLGAASSGVLNDNAAHLDDSVANEDLPAFRREDLKREDLTGVVLGPYKLGMQLGEGGMGTLYRAVHRQLGKACVVKFIHPSMSANGQAIGRFLQEIQAVGQLNHPHIVCAFDAGCCAGVHYYVTELLEGQDLQKLVNAHGPLPLEKTFSIIRQVLEALALAHQRGFVHRDIKPSNIFLTDLGHAKLLDFGLARNTQQSGEGLTTSEQLLGTLDYLAPEQAENPTQANAASDIYSLGLTWIYLLSGSSPFPDSHYSTTVSKLRGQLVDQPEWLARNPASLPTAIHELLSGMIVKNPDKRFNDCRQVIAWLDRCTSDRSASQLQSKPSPVRHRFGTSVKLAVSAAVAMLTIGVLAYVGLSSSSAISSSATNGSATSGTVAREAVAVLPSVIAPQPNSDQPQSEPAVDDIAANEIAKSEPATDDQPRAMPETVAGRTARVAGEVPRSNKPNGDGPATESTKTLSSATSTANAKVRRPGAINVRPNAAQAHSQFNDGK